MVCLWQKTSPRNIYFFSLRGSSDCDERHLKTCYNKKSGKKLVSGEPCCLRVIPCQGSQWKSGICTDSSLPPASQLILSECLCCSGPLYSERHWTIPPNTFVLLYSDVTVDNDRWLAPVKSYFLKSNVCPGWCGSVDWVRACEPKGCWFDSQSGHTPGLWARSPFGGMREATTHWCFSPSLSLPSPSL